MAMTIGDAHSDEALIDACRQGDRQAFDRLMERYQREIYRLCYRYVGHHEDASDMTQEVFIKVYKSIARFRGESAFSTWLYRIAVNTCLSFRSVRRPEGQELPDDIVSDAPHADDSIHMDQRSERVRRAIDRLPAKQRATLILKIYKDLKHEEVARVLNSSIGTVKANLFHAFRNLKKQLMAEGGSL
jgi:RNA polymerase sigma-70 factor (ECF subfamily)